MNLASIISNFEAICLDKIIYLKVSLNLFFTWVPQNFSFTKTGCISFEVIPNGKKDCLMIVSIGTDRKSARRRHFNIVGFKSPGQRLHAALHAIQCVEWVVQIWEWKHRIYNTLQHLVGILSCPYYRLLLFLGCRKFGHYFFCILENKLRHNIVSTPTSLLLWGKLKSVGYWVG